MPGFKTFASGDVLTAADVNDYLMEQAVIQVANTASRPSSPHEGMLIAQIDSNSLVVYNGAAWTDYGRWGAWDTFTPTITQSGSVTFNTSVARYCRIGTLVHVRCVLAVTGAGTNGQSIIVGNLPVAAGDVEYIGGSFEILDAGTGYYVGTVRGNSTTSVFFLSHLESGGVGQDPSFQLQNGDEIRFSLTYESA